MPRRKKKQTKIEESDDEQKILHREMYFQGMNGADYGNNKKKMCFQTFPPPWMQFS
jgi:hypothetical protein